MVKEIQDGFSFPASDDNIGQYLPNMRPVLCLGPYIHFWSKYYFNPVRSETATPNGSAGDNVLNRWTLAG